MLLVIGATGLLGQALLSETRHRHIDAVGAARHGADMALDITDSAQISEVFSKARPSVVFNAAAMTDISMCESRVTDAYDINARAVAFLADECRTSDAVLVHVSTDHFFTGDADAPHDEDAHVRLVNAYARTKYVGEGHALTWRRSLVVRTNFTGFRGWRDRPTFCEWALAALTEGRQITLFEDFHTSTIDVAELAVALLDLVEREATGLLNVASRDVSSKMTFVLALARALNLDPPRATPGSVRMLVPTRAESLGLDVSRAEACLGRPLPGLDMVVESLAAKFRLIRENPASCCT